MRDCLLIWILNGCLMEVLRDVNIVINGLNGNGFFYIYILLNFKFIWKNIDIDEDNFMII